MLARSYERRFLSHGWLTTPPPSFPSPPPQPKLGAPGFCTVQAEASFPDISSADGLLLTVRLTDTNPGALATFKVSMDSSVRASPRQGEFQGTFTATADTTTVFVPFSSMAQEWRGQREGGPPSKAQLAAIVGLGLNQDGTAGSFGIAITSIAAGAAAGPPPPPPAPGGKKLQLVNFIEGKGSGESIGAKWSTTNDPVMGGVRHHRHHFFLSDPLLAHRWHRFGIALPPCTRGVVWPGSCCWATHLKK